MAIEGGNRCGWEGWSGPQNSEEDAAAKGCLAGKGLRNEVRSSSGVGSLSEREKACNDSIGSTVGPDAGPGVEQ